MIVDCTHAIAYPDDDKRRRYPPDCLMIHRLGPRFPGWAHPLRTATDIARFYELDPTMAVTIGRMAYTFIGWRRDDRGPARIEQAVPLRYHTPHGYKWSHRSIGFALWGDWRSESPPEDLLDLAEVVAVYLLTMYPGMQILGHDEPKKLPASKDPDKVCPGAMFPLERFRERVEKRVKAGDIKQLRLLV